MLSYGYRKRGSINIYPKGSRDYSSGHVYYRETHDQHFLSKVNIDVKKHIKTEFAATQAVVATFINMTIYFHNTRKETFQAVIVSNNSSTFIILNYYRLDLNGADIGFYEPFCVLKQIYTPKTSKRVLATSNIGIRGRHVFEFNFRCEQPGKMLKQKRRCKIITLVEERSLFFS